MSEINENQLVFDKINTVLEKKPTLLDAYKEL